MLPKQQLNNSLKMLKEKDCEITLEIQLVTAWIREHRANMPFRAEAPSTQDHMKLQSWRKISYRLHQRRSELKNTLENIQTCLRTTVQKIEEMETDFSCFPAFLGTGLESEPALVGAQV